MSTSVLYHGFGVRGYRHEQTQVVDGRLVMRLSQPKESCRCSACGSREVVLSGVSEREFRSVPVGSQPVTIVLPIPRVACRACGLVRQVAVKFAEPRRSYTKSIARYALELSRLMTIKDVACHLGVSWDMIKEILKSDLGKRVGKPKLRHLKRIAIDEISVGKGHRYLTLVLDLDSGAIVPVGEGKDGAALNVFWKRRHSSHAKIEAVATDMSPAFIQAVGTNLPNAALVFDRFHVMKLFNDKLSDLRRQMFREATDQLDRQVLKGTRYLRLKRPHNLDNTQNERQRLDAALELNQSLFTADYLREDLAEFWEQDDQEEAEAFLLDGIARAEASEIKMLVKFAKTLRNHALGLLAWYDHPISTGPLEGTNNKIKTMKRPAYGFRDQEFLKLKIYALHEAKYALVG